MRKVLITGGFGYIGSRLVKHLHNEGHQIIIGSRNVAYQRNWLTQVKIVFTDFFVKLFPYEDFS